MTYLYNRMDAGFFEYEQPVSGTHTVTAGVIQCLTSDGYLTYADDSVTLSGSFLPVEPMRNNSAGVSGDLNQRVQTKVMTWISGSGFTKGHIGGPVFANSTSTATATVGATTGNCLLGELVDYDSTRSNAPLLVFIGVRPQHDAH